MTAPMAKITNMVPMTPLTPLLIAFEISVPLCPYRAATPSAISVAKVMLTWSGPSATSLPNITTEATMSAIIEPTTNNDAAIDGWTPPPSGDPPSSSMSSGGELVGVLMGIRPP